MNTAHIPRRRCVHCIPATDHKLILTGLEQALEPTHQKKGRLNLEHGLVPRIGKSISITNEEIYELGFP
jgi:hypothetical protein